jgi:hypothetical protein
MAIKHEYVSILLACCLAVQPVPTFGQEKPPESAPADEVQRVAMRELSKEIVIQRFQELSKESRSAQLLDGKLRSLQFLPAAEKERYWGHTSTYQRTVEGRPEHLIYTIYVHDYVKSNSKDGAALAQVTLTNSSGGTTTYSFFLVAPDGDVKRTQEYAVSNGEIQLQHSWSTCLQGQLSTVGGTCASAVVSCAIPSPFGGPFSWAAYLGCVAVACAGAFVKAALCCACNGSSWCSWAVGSCSQAVPPSGPACEVWDPYTDSNVPCPPLHTGQRCCGTTTIDKKTMEELCCQGEVINGSCRVPGPWVKAPQQCP